MSVGVHCVVRDIVGFEVSKYPWEVWEAETCRVGRI